MSMPIDAQENVLSKIFSFLMAAKLPTELAENSRPILLNQLGECAGFLSLDAQHQLDACLTARRTGPPTANLCCSDRAEFHAE
jgi:hypothetical protein